MVEPRTPSHYTRPIISTRMPSNHMINALSFIQESAHQTCTQDSKVTALSIILTPVESVKRTS